MHVYAETDFKHFFEFRNYVYNFGLMKLYY
jgi:hypothetical protein